MPNSHHNQLAPKKSDVLKIRALGLQPYEPVWREMQAFTDQRNEQTLDELWWLQHQSVFTLGQAGKRHHLLNPGDIPILQVDRGGQVTYHGPGQLVIYLMLDLRRAGLGVRQLVTLLEQSVIRLLAGYDIQARARSDAPGVYVNEAKIASLGLRVRRGCSFHGLSLNVNTALEPFSRINPCGHPGLEVTRLVDLGINQSMSTLAEQLGQLIAGELGYRTDHE
ncbi:MAG: lipoyl(octanoyl) transferase LipB [Gammaproteobacteria bacterium]|nr:lipoyl(octanoyl) transferase LipB [Gammaproteobacteria bacterium]